MTVSTLLNRHTALGALLLNARLDGFALLPGANLYYLTGVHFHLFERPVIALFTSHFPPILILPELEMEKARQINAGFQLFPYSENPSTWSGVVQQALAACHLDRVCQVGVDPYQFRLLEMRILEDANPNLSFTTAPQITAQLRIRKDKKEMDAIRKAVTIAQEALLATLPLINSGVTEKQVASELTIQLLRCGSDPHLPFTPIVASGPNSANPHATPTDRILSVGDLVVIDWGAFYQGYCSDLTRTFAIQVLHSRQAEVGEIVLAANQAGRSACAPGISTEQVDQSARNVIDQAGFGKFFIHRTGHGIGLEPHEEPYIRGGNDMILESGMTFTIEPGVYLAGEFGVRIEDNVHITSDGAESLSDLVRQIKILGEP